MDKITEQDIGKEEAEIWDSLPNDVQFALGNDSESLTTVATYAVLVEKVNEIVEQINRWSMMGRIT